jgi:hypothetical protein
VNRMVRQAQFLADDVGRAPGKDSKDGLAGSQSVDNLVDGPISPTNQDKFRTLTNRLLRQLASHAGAGGCGKSHFHARFAKDRDGLSHLSLAARGPAAGNRIVDERNSFQRRATQATR